MSVTNAAASAGAGTASWWGTLDIAPGEGRYLRVGPSELWIRRERHEWVVDRCVGSDPLDERLELPRPLGEAEAAPEDSETFRVAHYDGRGGLRVMPLLADRTVLSRPRSSFIVLPAQETTLYVSTPLWVRLESEDGRAIAEFPLFRPSDTWLGTSTLDGELCYASRTHCRLDLEDVPFRPHRAVTLLRVENRSHDPLPLERMSVPAPYLSLYAIDRRLWTERVDLTWKDDEENASFEIRQGPPRSSPGVRPIAAPRRAGEAGGLVSAIRAFL